MPLRGQVDAGLDLEHSDQFPWKSKATAAVVVLVYIYSDRSKRLDECVLRTRVFLESPKNTFFISPSYKLQKNIFSLSEGEESFR